VQRPRWAAAHTWRALAALVPKAFEVAAEIMRTNASFHAEQAGRNLAERTSTGPRDHFCRSTRDEAASPHGPPRLRIKPLAYCGPVFCRTGKDGHEMSRWDKKRRLSDAPACPILISPRPISQGCCTSQSATSGLPRPLWPGECFLNQAAIISAIPTAALEARSPQVLSFVQQLFLSANLLTHFYGERAVEAD
jgi:hypothetical protein